MSSQTTPTYAVLGATGNTGLSLIRVLLQSPNRNIHAYCRSREKLERLLPETINNSAVQVYAGALDDTALLVDCIRGTRAVFLAVAVSDNVPGNTIAYDTARHVISALEILRDEKVTKLPTLVVLSAAPLEPKFVGDAPWLVHVVLLRAFSNIYSDLAEAEKLLRSHSSWITSIFVKPGAISREAQRGHEISTEEVRSPVSFMDVAAGMVELADAEAGQYDMKSVAVNPATNDVPFDSANAKALLKGLVYHFFPWTYGWI